MHAPRHGAGAGNPVRHGAVTLQAGNCWVKFAHCITMTRQKFTNRQQRELSGLARKFRSRKARKRRNKQFRQRKETDLVNVVRVNFKDKGRSFYQALDHLVRGGCQRQVALRVVRKAYGLKQQRGSVRIVQGGRVSPR